VFFSIQVLSQICETAFRSKHQAPRRCTFTSSIEQTRLILQGKPIMPITRNALGTHDCEQEHFSALREREEIQAIAEARLRRSGYCELHNVSCRFFEGVLTLRGCVPSWYLKQVAQSLVLSIEGVQELNNRLEVVA
jgi:osmotically-inducible protein OsmY